MTHSVFGRCPGLPESGLVVNSVLSISAYALNYGTTSHMAFVPSSSKRLLTQFKRPSTTMMYMDAANPTVKKASWYLDCYMCSGGTNTVYDPRHMNGCNMALFDGHVEWQKPAYFQMNVNDHLLHDPANRLK